MEPTAGRPTGPTTRPPTGPATGGTAAARTDGQRLNEAAAALGPLARRLSEHGQPEAARLVEGWRTWADQPTVVAVVGEVKRGKSTLVNALAGQPVSPTGVDVVTSGEVVVCPPTNDLPAGRARLVHEDGTTVLVSAAAAVEALTPREAGPDSAAGAPTGTGSPRPVMAQVAVTPRWLPDVALIDTPGVGGLVGAHAAVARAVAERAGALLFVSDGGQVLTRPELEFLRDVALAAEYVVLALTKVDRTDTWQVVLDENRALLAEHAPRFAPAPIVPVAAGLAEAAWDQDPVTAGILEKASRIEELAQRLSALTGNRRRVAVAKALRIALTGLDSALAAVAVEEGALDSPEAVQDLRAERDRLIELSQRRSYVRVFVERDLARARSDALALMNTLVDEATAELTAQAQGARGQGGHDQVTDQLGRRLKSVVEQVRDTFVAGVAAAVEAAFRGLEPPTDGSADPGAGTTDEPGGAGGEVAMRALADLLPGTGSLGTAGAVQLGRVVTTRSVARTPALDPSMASYAFMGTHLGSMLGFAGPLAPLFAAGWVAVNLTTRRSREGRQQLVLAIGDSFGVLRRDLPGVLDAAARELRPELIIDVERTLDSGIERVKALLKAAAAAQQAQDRERRSMRALLQARRTALADQRRHVESLLDQIGPPAPA